MKVEMLKERVELLEIGEQLGYPRLGIGHANGRKHAIRAGQSEWEKFCAHAHTTRIPAALRIGRVLRDNGVMKYHPLSGKEAFASIPITTPPSLELIDTVRESLLDEIVIPSSVTAGVMLEHHTPPGTVAVYPPGKRRKKPSRKNKAKV